jgi:hypothetical protein
MMNDMVTVILAIQKDVFLALGKASLITFRARFPVDGLSSIVMAQKYA